MDVRGAFGVMEALRAASGFGVSAPPCGTRESPASQLQAKTTDHEPVYIATEALREFAIYFAATHQSSREHIPQVSLPMNVAAIDLRHRRTERVRETYGFSQQ
jgi:hypothetical protein